MAEHHSLLGSTGDVRQVRTVHLLGENNLLLGQDKLPPRSGQFLLGQDNFGKGSNLCLSRFARGVIGHATPCLCVHTTLGGSIQYKLHVSDCLAWLRAAIILCSTQDLRETMT